MRSGAGSGSPQHGHASEGCVAAEACPICLSEFGSSSERARVVPCLHEYCYPCISRWAGLHRECPLCKANFGSILHSIRSDSDYSEQVLPPLPPPDSKGQGNFGSSVGHSLAQLTALRDAWSHLNRSGGSASSSWRQPRDPRRFAEHRDRLRGSNPERRPHNEPQRAPDGTLAEPRPYFHRLQRQLHARTAEDLMQQLEAREAPKEDAALLWRRSLYSRGLWAQPVTPPGPFAVGAPPSAGPRVVAAFPAFHGTAPATHARCPAAGSGGGGSGGALGEQRLDGWATRELQALLQQQDVVVVKGLALSLLRSQRQSAPEQRVAPEEALRPFLHHHAAHFWHELTCFASSPYSATTYDRVVRYAPSAAEAASAVATPRETNSAAAIAGSVAVTSSAALRALPRPGTDGVSGERRERGRTAQRRAPLPSTAGTTHGSSLRTGEHPPLAPIRQRNRTHTGGNHGRTGSPSTSRSRWDQQPTGISGGRDRLSTVQRQSVQRSSCKLGPSGCSAADAILLSSDDEGAESTREQVAHVQVPRPPTSRPAAASCVASDVACDDETPTETLPTEAPAANEMDPSLPPATRDGREAAPIATPATPDRPAAVATAVVAGLPGRRAGATAALDSSPVDGGELVLLRQQALQARGGRTAVSQKGTDSWKPERGDDDSKGHHHHRSRSRSRDHRLSNDTRRGHSRQHTQRDHRSHSRNHSPSRPRSRSYSRTHDQYSLGSADAQPPSSRHRSGQEGVTNGVPTWVDARVSRRSGSDDVMDDRWQMD